MSVRHIDPAEQASIIALLQSEHDKALSRREWTHRLAGYGYAITHTDHGDMVTALPRGEELCALPPQLCN